MDTRGRCRRYSHHTVACAALLLGLAAPVAGAEDPPIDGIGVQLRLAPRGPDGTALGSAARADLAYNSRRDEFLVVWQDRDVRSITSGVYGLRLDRRGAPISPVRLLNRQSWSTVDATAPAVAYDRDHDRYLLAYERETYFYGSETVELRVLAGDGVPASTTTIPASADDAADAARPVSQGNPDIAYDRASRTFVVVWDQGAETGRGTILATAVDPGSGQALGTPSVMSDSCAAPVCHAFGPVVASSGEGYLVAWVQTDAAGAPGAVWARHVQGATPAADVGSVRVAGERALHPGAAVHQDRALIVYTEDAASMRPAVHAAAVVLDGPRMHVRAPGRRVESDNGAGAERPAVSFHSGRNSFLVAWNATPEREVVAQLIDADGRERGLDDFRISNMGFAGSNKSGTLEHPPALAENLTTGEWLVAWAGEEDRPPLAAGASEMWARRVGPNADRDLDGSSVPDDCDDLDPRVHPGAREIASNGIDEDCSGSDGRDGDGDGAAPPADCDDADPLVRPGIRDIAGNGVDEDCDGHDRWARTRARVFAVWRFSGLRTTVVRLAVHDARRAVTVGVRCRGAGCPARLRGAGRVARPRSRGRLQLAHMLGGARLARGTVVEVTVREPNAVGIVERYIMRGGAPPRHSTRCIAPRARRSSRCGR